MLLDFTGISACIKKKEPSTSQDFTVLFIPANINPLTQFFLMTMRV